MPVVAPLGTSATHLWRDGLETSAWDMNRAIATAVGLPGHGSHGPRSAAPAQGVGVAAPRALPARARKPARTKAPQAEADLLSARERLELKKALRNSVLIGKRGASTTHRGARVEKGGARAVGIITSQSAMHRSLIALSAGRLLRLCSHRQDQRWRGV